MPSAASSTVFLLLGAIGFGAGLQGCAGGMSNIDRKTLALLEETSRNINANATAAYDPESLPPGNALPPTRPDPSKVRTVNPDAEQLSYERRTEAEDIAARLGQIGTAPYSAVLGLEDAVAYAVANSREYRNAADAYVITVLSLVAERHLWGPRFFDTITVAGNSVGDEGLFNSTLDMVNEFTVTQRLPYGGEVSASLIAAATEDLTERVGDASNQSATAILAANIPLLRGAGLAAREDLIQAERNVVYAARDFERFRREFYFDVVTDYFDLVVRQQNIANAQRQVEGFERTEVRELALVNAGRQEAFQAALAAQDTLFARDRLAAQVEQYRLALDRFKVRIGMPPEQPVEIEMQLLDLPIPEIDPNRAVMTGLTLRLDLQTSRDQVEDGKRRIDVAKNNTLPDLDLFGSVSIPTDPTLKRSGLQFRPDYAELNGGVRLDLPLDREIEETQVRRAQVLYEQVLRNYLEFRDSVAVEIRSAARAIDRAIFSVRLQEENVRIAEIRQASIDAAPDRATARDRSDAVQALLEARDSLDRARRDLQVAILAYLLTTDQLRVQPNGEFQVLPGMGGSEAADPVRAGAPE